MDVKKIEELIRVLEASPTEELCVQKGAYKVCIRKGAKASGQASRQASGATQAGASGRETSPEASSREVSSPEASSHEPAGAIISATMVGIFHVVDGIAHVGGSVAKGEVVGAIESMKLTNDIRSSVTGIVREVLVEDGMPIEYGQPLFRVEPE